MIAIVDYGRGNLFSIAAAVRQFTDEFEVTADADTVERATGLVLPGVGAFGDAVARLRGLGLWERLISYGQSGRPFLGICLGMQLLADGSEEFGEHEGLALVPGTVRVLPPFRKGPDASRVPNVGWRPLKIERAHPFLSPLATDDMMYFVHSYAPVGVPDENKLASIGVNGQDVVAVVARDNIIGCQFHPEKSGAKGLALIERFVEMVSSFKDISANPEDRER